jgi:hypothetical protein
VIRQMLQSHLNQENREMEEAITKAKAGDRARYDNDLRQPCWRREPAGTMF